MNKKILITALLPLLVNAEVVKEPLVMQCPPGTEQRIAERYQFFSDGTVVDRHTGLQWQRCFHGQTFNDQGTEDYKDDHCDGDVVEVANWRQLMQLAEEQYQLKEGWRLPNSNELHSTVDESCALYFRKNNKFRRSASRNNEIFISAMIVRMTGNSSSQTPYIELTNTLLPKHNVFVRKVKERRSYSVPAFSTYPESQSLGVFPISIMNEIHTWYPEFSDTHHDYVIRWVKEYES